MCRVMRGEGLSEEAIQDILLNLYSDHLTEKQVLMIRYTRNTTAYDTVSIQKEIKNLQQVLSPEELIECVGLAALANAVARLSLLFHIR